VSDFGFGLEWSPDGPDAASAALIVSAPASGTAQQQALVLHTLHQARAAGLALPESITVRWRRGSLEGWCSRAATVFAGNEIVMYLMANLPDAVLRRAVAHEVGHIHARLGLSHRLTAEAEERFACGVADEFD